VTGVADTLARGAAIGFAIAAPVGPIGLLCIRRTLAQGLGAGVASGVGAAAADALYGLLAALGLGALAAVLVEHAAALRVAGGLLLAWLGASALRRAAVMVTPGTGMQDTGRGGSGLAAAFGSTFALTLANPMTVLSFAGVVAALAGPGNTGAGVALVAGVFAGSVAWWLLLVGGVSVARRALPPSALRWIEGASGAALLLFGAYAALAGLGLA
jgi:putative LysE/RhtB family amino acid efflux pump